MKTALFWERAGEKIRCLLCPHHCLIGQGQRGLCQGRVNRNGVLQAASFGQVASIAVDPIEKKPLNRFLPGSTILSVGTWGCNLSCSFCQNWQLSQRERPSQKLSPSELVELALELKAQDQGMVGIAYTYSEPLVWYEYVLQTAQLAKEAGLVNVLVTNGYLEHKPLEKLLPFIDAVNMDLKSMKGEFYKKYCGVGEGPPLKSAKLFYEAIHLELTTLLIPGVNDSDEEIKELAAWIATELDREVPLHLSRYFPQYKLALLPTPLATLERALELARKELAHVYLGNV